MQRLTLGDFELTAVSDGDYFLDGGAYFGVVPKVLWERKVKVDEKNRVLTGLNSVVVRSFGESQLGNQKRLRSASPWDQIWRGLPG